MKPSCRLTRETPRCGLLSWTLLCTGAFILKILPAPTNKRAGLCCLCFSKFVPSLTLDSNMVGQFVVQLNGLQMETSELPSCSSDLLFLNSCVLNLETQTGSGVIQQSEGGHEDTIFGLRLCCTGGRCCRLCSCGLL